MAHSDIWRLRELFSKTTMQNDLFPHLSYLEVSNLMEAFKIPLRRESYVHARVTCESGYHPGPQHLPAMPGWRQFVIGHKVFRDGASVFDREEACHNDAKVYNASTACPAYPLARREPSLCVEPTHLRDVVPNGTNQLWRVFAPRVVCIACKAMRGRAYKWRKELLCLGVCHACRKWALENMEPYQDDCVCGVPGRYEDGIHNNEERCMHLYYEHDRRLWITMRHNAKNEQHTRLLQKRVVKRKRGNGWAQKKHRGTKVRTPDERRRATRIVAAAPGLLAAAPGRLEPTCYCGEHVGAVGGVSGHDRVNNITNRVRNCLGCNKFRRLE